jgi:hypothetical protein
MRTIGFPNGLRLLRGHCRIPTPFGLIRGVVAPSFFCKIVLSISVSQSMVVKNLWQPSILLCFPRILHQRILGNYLMFSRRADALIELNLVAGANFTLGWIRKWHPRLNYSSMSLSLPLGPAMLQVHMDATHQPARSIIARLLEADASFFHEYHYLNPLLIDDSDQIVF